MLKFVLRRLVISVLVAITVSLLTFVLLRLAGDPAAAIAGEGSTAADVERVRVEYGFDRPLWVSYGMWLGRILSGDFGYSPVLRADVAPLILERLPVTLTLGFLALIVALLIAMPLGVAAGLRPRSIVDRIAIVVSTLGQAIPTFWLGLTLILYFGLYWRMFPTSGSATLKHMVLPAVTLGFYSFPGMLRLVRSGVIDSKNSDYIRTARSKGLSPLWITFRHIMPNALIPVVSLAAVQFGMMLGGSIVVEAIFSINGLGQLAWQAIQRTDVEVLQGVVLTIALIYILLMFVADLLNSLIDPRIRVS